MRQPEGAKRTAANGGYVHVIRQHDYLPPSPAPRRIEPPADLSPIVAAAVAATSAEWLERLAQHLRLPHGGGVIALRRLGAHRYREHVSGWPMRDASGRVVGIRYRARDGAKWSHTGGKEGLFTEWPMPVGERLFLPEGGSDTAALIALGLPAAGRPSCNGGVNHVRALVRELLPSAVVVVADADERGQRGACDLATLLALHVPDTRIVTPPPPSKDVRAMLATGAGREDVEALIAAAPRVGLRVAGVSQ